MSIEDLNRSKDMLLAINPKQVIKPRQPVDGFIKEVHKLYYWSKDDKTKLINIGITEEDLDSLLPLSRSLKAAESLWNVKRSDLEDTRKQWLIESEEAKELRSIILHSFHYAYRDNVVVAPKLKYIGTGNSNADLIQDLSDLPEIGRKYPEELETINFDMSLLDKASVTSDRIGDLLGQSEANDIYHEALDLRNRAYTKLFEVVKKVRAAGQYVFWRDNNRFDGYVSEYQRKHKSSSKNETIDFNKDQNTA